MKSEPDAWEYNWVTLPLGGTSTDTWPSMLGVERKIDVLAL
jgi:hypothetical protein